MANLNLNLWVNTKSFFLYFIIATGMIALAHWRSTFLISTVARFWEGSLLAKWQWDRITPLLTGFVIACFVFFVKWIRKAKKESGSSLVTQLNEINIRLAGIEATLDMTLPQPVLEVEE